MRRASVPEVQHNWAFRLSGQSMNCASGSLGSHRNRAVVSPPVVRPGCPGVRSPMATVDPTTAAAIERRMGKKRVSFAHLGSDVGLASTGTRRAVTADGSGPVRAGPFDGGSTCQDLPPLLPQVQVPAACSPAVVAYDPDALPELVDSVESALQAGPLRLAVAASDVGLGESLEALHIRRRWLLSQDLAGDEPLRDEWLSVVGELDLKTRKILGVDECGGDASQKKPPHHASTQQQQLAQRRTRTRRKGAGGMGGGGVSSTLSKYLTGTRSASETETWEDDFMGTRVMSPPDRDELQGFGSLDPPGTRKREMTEM